MKSISDEKNYTTFSKDDTLFVKGVATIILLATHLFNRSEAAWVLFDYNPAWMIDGRPLITTLFTGSCGKVCVDLFVILSGYGLNLGLKARENRNNMIENSVRYTVVRIVKLMVNFWFVYLVFVPIFAALGKINITGVYGTGMKGVFAALIDFLGLQDILYEILRTGTVNVTWWYMSTVLILYALFPVLRICVRGKDRWYWLAALLLINLYAPFAAYRQMKTGLFFYIPAFYLGMLLSEDGLLDAFKRWTQKQQLLKLPLLLALLVATFFITRNDRYRGELLYSLAWLAVCIALFTGRFGILANKYCRTPFELIGKYSANIFFVHTFFLFGFPKFAYLPRNPILTLVWFVAWMTLVSWLVEQVKKMIRLKYLEAYLVDRV